MNTFAPATEPRTLVLFGIPFHDLTMQETMQRIDRLISDRSPAYLVTANLDFAAQASEDVELQRILVEADLVLCDGTPLVWASRLTGKPLRERVAGSDLVPLLAAHAEKKGYRIFLLGGELASLEGATRALARDYPALPEVRYFSPPFAPLHEFDNQQILEEIQAARPDILLVAFGCPKQEKWIYMHYRRLGVPCCIGVGATVDFLAGKVSRAPTWVARTGLEWIYRMAQEPRRLAGRYWKDLRFLARQALRESRAIAACAPPEGEEKTSARPTEIAGGVEVVAWEGGLTAARAEHFPMPSFAGSFVIDLSAVTGVDSRGLGVMLRVIRKAWAGGVGACFLAPSRPVRRVVEAARLERILPLVETLEEARALIEKEVAAAGLRPVSGGERVVVFNLPTRVSVEVAESFGAAVREEWERHPSLAEVVLDCAETRFIDSSGLGFLIRCHRMVGRRPGARLRLLNLRENVLNVIRVAKLEGILLPG